MNGSLTLLVGMPRSGTTWIAKIFDSHPDTLYRHEPDSGNALRALPLIAACDDLPAYAPMLREFVGGLARLRHSRSAGSLPIFRKSYQSPAGYRLRKLSVIAAKASALVNCELPVSDGIVRQKAARLHLVWKSIESLGRIGAILRAIPECRALIIQRHPCGYVASVLNGEAEKRFDGTTASADDFPVYAMLLERSPRKRRNPTIDDLRSMSRVERLAWRWLLYNEIAMTDIAGCPRGSIVHYEEACARPLDAARGMLRFAGLAWHPQVETFVRSSTTRTSSRYYSVFKNPQDSAAKWQTQLTAGSIDCILRIVGQSDLGKLYASRTTISIPAALRYARQEDPQPDSRS